MTPTYDQRLAAALRILVPSDHALAPNFLSVGRTCALARAEAAFHRLNPRRHEGA